MAPCCNDHWGCLSRPADLATDLNELRLLTMPATSSRFPEKGTLSAALLQVLRYLGRYTHRVAISDHRLLDFDGERGSFRWRDYAHGNKPCVMTLDAVEFLRRFFLHILPKGFVRIRHFGFLANCFRTEPLALCRQLLDVVPPDPIPLATPEPAAKWHCPPCGALLILLARLQSSTVGQRWQRLF